MTSEEIKALGLRVGDVVRVTAVETIIEVDESGDYVWLANREHQHQDIVAIERVMPALPEGWTWGAPLGDPVDIARANHTGYSDWASIDHLGRLHGAGLLPALVAKALLEVWGRTQ